jgi:ParB-like chromosome segregation protein Spo0J
MQELGTTLSRARCLTPAQVEQMKRSLSEQGQLTPVIAVIREKRVELVDGFKRLAAAQRLGWTEVMTTLAPYDEKGQWIAMLALNRGPQSMTVLEEALVLREMVATGLTQTEIAGLLGRHKSWVSRRIGMVERLHPEVIGAVRTGLLPAGAARRLMALPAGNQVEMATVVARAGLGAQQTEQLVSLWHKARAPEIRAFLLRSPHEALAHAYPETTRPPPDLRLSPRGQALQRSLRVLQGAVLRITEAMSPRPAAEEMEILEPEMLAARDAVWRLEETLGFVGVRVSCAEGSAPNATR